MEQNAQGLFECCQDKTNRGPVEIHGTGIVEASDGKKSQGTITFRQCMECNRKHYQMNAGRMGDKEA